MSDVIFIGATIAFFAICALYVHWCDKIIGPDEFRATGEAATPADVVGTGNGVAK
jgi:hypothetical protein